MIPNMGIAMPLAPPIKLMVGIPPTKIVMNGGWFMTLLCQHDVYIMMDEKSPFYNCLTIP